MAKKLAYERYIWFHAKLARNRYPRLQELADKFEISRRQAAREIDFMRLFFGAPIAWSAERSGYYYSRTGFELPGPWVGDEEILALLIAKRLSTAIPDSNLKSTINDHLGKVCLHAGIDLANFERRVSLKNVRYYRVPAGVFAAVIPALSRGVKLCLRYRSTHTGQASERTVSPLHLLLYMGNWHLLAHCDTKSGLRNFALSRIEAITPLADPVPADLLRLDVRRLVDQNYGIFLTGTPVTVRLRFRLEAAAYVREQVWFPGQILQDNPDGTLDLSFPVTDLREVVRDVLPFAAQVEVLAPPALRRRVAEAAAAVVDVYTKGD